MRRYRELFRAPLAAYAVVLLAACSYVLWIQRDGLFWHLDGYMIRQTIDGQFAWLRPSLTLGLDPLRGPGTLFFPMNARLLPIFALQELLLGGHISRVLTYVVYGVQTILVMCLLARHCDLPARVGALAGLIVIMLTMPLIWTQQTTPMFPLFALTPHWFDLLAFVVLFFVVYGRIGRGSLVNTVCLSALSAGGTFLMIAISPLWGVLLGPVCGAIVLAHLAATTGSERMAKGLAAVSIVTALALSGVLLFAYATVGSGAVRLFGSEIPVYQSGPWWSSLVHQYDRYPAAAATVSLGMFVALAYLRPSIRLRANTACKVAALLTAALGFMFLVAWGIVDHVDVLRNQLKHIRLFYFELPLLPFYALFAALAIGRGLQVLTRRFPKPQLAADTAVVLMVVAAVVPGLRDIRDTNPYAQPAGATPITRLLTTEIGVDPGSRFRGRVATVFPGGDSPAHAVSWDGMIAHDIARYRVQQNDHRFVGLWEFQIPTFQEYSQMITPGTYFWVTRAMSVASDTQDMRNHAIITRPNARLMRLFGVRYVISPKPIANPEFALRTAFGGDHLYEIAGANLGQYYARRVVRADGLAEMLRAMHDTPSQLDTTWVYETVPPALSPGRVEIVFVPSGIRATGTSDGTSLMLLPFTFSRCFALTVNAGDQASRLVRANLNMLGLLFSGSVDATLTLATGPFTRPGCLLADVRDLQQLGITEAAREFPRGSLVEPN